MVMSKQYLRKTIAEEELLSECGKSKKGQMKGTIKRIKFFIETEYKKKPEVVLNDIKVDLEKTGDPTPTQRLVKKFFWEHCRQDQPDLLIIRPQNKTKGHMKALGNNTMTRVKSCLRDYLKQCHGIKIDYDDWKEIKLPDDGKDRPPALALTKEELLIIREHAPSYEFKLFIDVLVFTSARDFEVLGLELKDFHFKENPVKIHFPRNKVKNKTRSKDCYIPKELGDKIKKLPGEKPFPRTTANQMLIWRRLMHKLADEVDPKFGEKYEHNGWLKRTIHSIRAYTETTFTRRIGREFASWYSGETDKTRGGDYDRYTAEALDNWKKCEKALSLNAIEVPVDVTDERIEQLSKDLKLTKRTADNFAKRLEELTELSRENMYKSIIDPESTLRTDAIKKIAFEDKKIEKFLLKFREVLINEGLEKAEELAMQDEYFQRKYILLDYLLRKKPSEP